jgi:hypothetical protein
MFRLNSFFIALSWALLLPSVCFASSQPTTIRPESTRISNDLKKALREIKRSFWVTDSGRHLLSLTEDLPIVEQGASRGPMVIYEAGDPGRIIVDSAKAKTASALDFEVAFFTARQFAILKPPVALIDAEFAARQALLEYILEKAAVRPDFAKRLRRATQRGEDLARSRRKKFEFAENRATDGRVLFPGHLPRRSIDALGYQLYLFSEDPFLFYESVVGSRSNPAAVSMTELEDFMDKHGAHMERGRLRAVERTALLDGRMYPGRVLQAARVIGDQEGLVRVRERLGPFSSLGQEHLLKKVNAWLRMGK